MMSKQNSNTTIDRPSDVLLWEPQTTQSVLRHVLRQATQLLFLKTAVELGRGVGKVLKKVLKKRLVANNGWTRVWT